MENGFYNRNFRTIGIAYKPIGSLTLTFDAERLNWSRFDHQTLDFEHNVPGAGFSDMVVDFDWKDQLFIKIGLEYDLTKNFGLRTGYAFIETQVPDHTLSPAYPR